MVGKVGRKGWKERMEGKDGREGWSGMIVKSMIGKNGRKVW